MIMDSLRKRVFFKNYIDNNKSKQNIKRKYTWKRDSKTNPYDYLTNQNLAGDFWVLNLVVDK